MIKDFKVNVRQYESKIIRINKMKKSEKSFEVQKGLDIAYALVLLLV